MSRTSTPLNNSFAGDVIQYLDSKVSRQFSAATRFAGSESAFEKTGMSLWVKDPRRPEHADGIKLISVLAEKSKIVFLAYCDLQPALGFSALVELARCAELGSQFDVLHSVRFSGNTRLDAQGISGFILFAPATLGYSARVSPRPRSIPGSRFLFAVPVTGKEYSLFRASSAELIEYFERCGRDLMTWKLNSMEPIP